MHLQLQLVRQQDRGLGYLDRRSGILRAVLPMSKLQEKNREPTLCSYVAGNILYGLS